MGTPTFKDQSSLFFQFFYVLTRGRWTQLVCWKLKLGEGLLAGLALCHFQGVEPHGLAQGSALAHSHRISHLTQKNLRNFRQQLTGSASFCEAGSGSASKRWIPIKVKSRNRTRICIRAKRCEKWVVGSARKERWKEQVLHNSYTLMTFLLEFFTTSADSFFDTYIETGERVLCGNICIFCQLSSQTRTKRLKKT
jgi:hypothetical protein